MLNDLPQTLKDLRQMERSRLPLDTAMAARIKASDAPSFGHPDAKVTVVFFADYGSRSSLSLGLFLPQLQQHYRAEDLRVVFRHYPVSKGRISRAAAEASLAAAAQGRFLQYNDCLFNSQHDLKEETLERCAMETKLDLFRFRSDLSTAKYAPQVTSDLALGTEALISGAPYAFVNGQRYNGTNGAEGLRALIDETLAAQPSPASVVATH
jgi:protein-disulfide isomerase